MADEVDALGAAKLGGGLYLKGSEIPTTGIKIRVLTRDPMVFNDKFGNTKYVFAVYNITEDKVQIFTQGPGVVAQLQKINADPDFGGDIRKIDIKVTTNGKSGIEIRYTLQPVGIPSELSKEAVKTIVSNGFDLAEKTKKNNPGALRLSEVNAGKKLAEPEEGVEPEDTVDNDVDNDTPINLDEIPF